MLRSGDSAAREPAPAAIPSLSLLAAIALQTRLVREPLRRWRFRARLAEAPRGAGEPVLVFPGMGVGDLSTRTLRRYLRRHGFDARGWRLGRNPPEVPRTLQRALPRLEAFAAERGRAVALVGWSLGGLVARELARLRPDLVRRVITLGTPVVGGFKPTAIAGLFRIQGWDLDDVERRLAAAERTPIRVPVTAIWSRRDGIVAWPACVDRTTPGAENLEATSCHWGLGLDPDVLVALAVRLREEDDHPTFPGHRERGDPSRGGRTMDTTRLLLAGLAAIGAASAGFAAEAPSAAQQIAIAVQAAPEEFRAGATVLGYDHAGALLTLREGVNDLVCLAHPPGEPGVRVACYAKSLEPFMKRGRELKAQGVPDEERTKRRWKEAEDGILPMPKEPATLYVLSGTSVDAATGEVTEPYRRYVVYIPWATSASTGLPEKPVAPGAPWIMFPGTPGAHIMINPPKEAPAGNPPPPK